MGIGSALALGIERIIEPVEGMHTAIAGSWFDAIRPVGRRVRRPYEAMTRLVYGTVRLGVAAVGAGLDRVLSVEPSTLDAVQSWANGLFGDGLGRHEASLGTTMTVRVQDDVPVTGRLVVLVHGLGMTERCWEGNESRPGLAQALVADPALTPVLIRYNSGRSVADNGAQLADLLSELVSAWPVSVESIALVGHSMGGLVVAEACAFGVRHSHGWVEEVSEVVAIATPYRGAPLEKLVAAAAWGLGMAKTTRPLAGFLDGRSRGIKDLGFTRERADDVFPANVRQHVLAGVATSDPTHPLAMIIGDLMVRSGSSTSARGVEPENTLVLGGVNHFDILNNPAAVEQVMAWLAPREN